MRLRPNAMSPARLGWTSLFKDGITKTNRQTREASARPPSVTYSGQLAPDDDMVKKYGALTLIMATRVLAIRPCWPRFDRSGFSNGLSPFSSSGRDCSCILFLPFVSEPNLNRKHR